MTDLDLAAIRERAEAATPGPWEWQPPSDEEWPIADESLLSPGTGKYVLVGWGYDASGIEGETADREFIAHAREDIPALLDEIDRLNAKLAWFETSFPCDGGCVAVNEVQEDCSQHGWTPQELWDELDVRTRDWRRAESIIQRVREIERRMDEYAHRSGPCTGVNCGGCQAGRFSTALRRALEGGDS